MNDNITLVYSDTLILNTLVISEVNEYGAISIKSRLGDAWIQDHFDFFLVDGIFGSKRINSLEEGVAYVKEQYLGQYKKLLQF